MSSLSARDRVFGLPELLRLIFESLSIGSLGSRDNRALDPEARQSLAVLARTCRVFSEPSLDLLWWRLNSLKPLTECYAGIVDEQLVGMPPSPAEREVINKYSRHIRELVVADELSLYFLKIMSFCSLSLPNLMVLKWDATFTWDAIMYIRPLLTPSIVSLDATIQEKDNATALSFLQYYPLLCPRLKSLKLNLNSAEGIRHNPSLFIGVLSGAIESHHKNLDCLKLSNPTTIQVLQQLLASSSLRELSLMGYHGSQDGFLKEISIPPTDTPLRDVRDLHLSISDLDVITNLLRPNDQTFRTIHFHVEYPPTTMQKFSTGLATHPRQHSLQSIILDHLHNRPEGAICRGDVMEFFGHLYILSYEKLSPFRSLGQLRKLVIHLLNGISLDDGELAELASGWPMLEVLRLDPLLYQWGAWPTAKSVTLSGLLPLLASCPKLRELQLPLDARQVPETTSPEPCNSAIDTLCFDKRPLSDSDGVARFLRTHLPSLKRVTMSEYVGSGEYDRLWKEVEEKLDGSSGLAHT